LDWVFAITGEICGGKVSFLSHLKKELNPKSLDFSDFIGDILDKPFRHVSSNTKVS